MGFSGVSAFAGVCRVSHLVWLKTWNEGVLLIILLCACPSATNSGWLVLGFESWTPICLVLTFVIRGLPGRVWHTPLRGTPRRSSAWHNSDSAYTFKLRAPRPVLHLKSQLQSYLLIYHFAPFIFNPRSGELNTRERPCSGQCKLRTPLIQRSMIN
ncbi:hypothetical protein ASPVEDRAFT_750180 [Aspergillus versicolor CBS 583.65]|uniref:Uncharacterized protein n=1 Tax=Aspergillus versicolor CBS 583.65 TaxID=1036611 RepID=A0A1L9PQJ3_ASPVE|nr:uncharacterized protein ASPVEDRAFT_750180 [Aspergillus versicolor CBS 583.65]OJJ03722.1 hypothetical protein ASPVEDRAFT_750180 [Aspergillus versicolor CBS 583.65]